MNKKTFFRLISIARKELDELLLQKINLEQLIETLEIELLDMEKSFNKELNLLRDIIFLGFNSGEFIRHELDKRAQKKQYINTAIQALSILMEEILDKNIYKEQHQELLDKILKEEKVKEEKSEMMLLDEFSTKRYLQNA